MILSQRNNSIKRTFAVGWADWLGRTAESMMQFGKAVRRYCHVSVQYVQPLTVRPHLYMNAAAPLYHLESGSNQRDEDARDFCHKTPVVPR